MCSKIYCLYEVEDLIFDPVILMIVIDILDDAFELEFASVKDIFKLRVGTRYRNSMRLRWKRSWGTSQSSGKPYQVPTAFRPQRMSLFATTHSSITSNGLVSWQE